MEDFKSLNRGLFHVSYMPPLSEFVRMVSYSTIIIDGSKPFKKSTTRNRCRIVGANGVIMLSIPVQGGRGVKKMVRDIRIDYSQRWQQVHWGSITSAYRKSSWFQFYEEKFRLFYEKQFPFLFDFNLELLETCFGILNIDIQIIKSVENPETISDDINNEENKVIDQGTYHQVFEERHGFISNLSIIDLIFNLGSDGNAYLAKLCSEQ